MTRHLIFCFDGTWNGRDDPIPTNIRRIHRGLTRSGEVSLYFAGPGNEDENNWFTEKLGGAFGWGTDSITEDALLALAACYRPEDYISVFGFSRGATIARLFCAAVGQDGVHQGRHHPIISFLGCFDTVAAFLPVGPSQQGLFHDLHVHPCVVMARHAVAMDEDRKAFVPNLMNRRQGVEEVWFRGAHSDVGGGEPDPRLSDVALDWMLQEAHKCAGLHIRLEQPTVPDPQGPIHLASGRYRRSKRRVGVMVSDNWSTEEPVIYKEQ